MFDFKDWVIEVNNKLQGTGLQVPEGTFSTLDITEPLNFDQIFQTLESSWN